MKESVVSTIIAAFGTRRAREIWRLAAGSVLLIGSVACTTVPSDSTDSNPVPGVAPGNSLAGANAMYSKRNYGGAIREFDTIIASADASANSRRLSYLGKALIYLGSDKNWRSMENAKIALVAAGKVVPDSTEGFSIETDMFMGSVEALISSESEHLELRTKSSDSKAEIARLKKQRDALTMERDRLLKEQQSLQKALEKLKNLTLGN